MELGPLLVALAAFLAGAVLAWIVARSRLVVVERLSERREQELAQLRAEHAATAQEFAALRGRLDAEREAFEQERAAIERLEQEVAKTFAALSADALQKNNQSFLQLANEALAKMNEMAKGELEKRQQAIGELVKPVRESLDKVDAKIVELEKARAGAYEGMTKQIAGLLEAQQRLVQEATTLRAETSGLRQALRNPTVRGRWGEMQLQRVVEMAGMREHVDFVRQETVEADDGETRRRLRPDMVVKLPNHRSIVVDAKTPTEAFLDAIESSDEEVRRAKMVEFARHVRSHVDALGRKAYWEQFDQTPDFVVMFLPGEHLYSAALEQDPGLIEAGVAQNVILATPTTLIALLRAVAFGWRQEQLAENAREISELGADLYKRLATLGEHLTRLGRSLGGAVDAYNRAIGSAERMVIPAARKLKELSAVHDGAKEIELDAIEASPRPVQSAELFADDVDIRLPLGPG